MYLRIEYHIQNDSDHDSLSYRKICNLRAQLVLDYQHGRGRGQLAREVKSTPLGFHMVELMLSALRLYNFRAFDSLQHFDRHQVVASLLQHSAGMRFGHFAARMYEISAFAWSSASSEFVLSTDWHRYSGVHRYAIRFPAQPRRRALRYNVYTQDGKVVCTLTAAKVLMWHFSLLRSHGGSIVIDPSCDGSKPDRLSRQRWLRGLLLASLPDSETAARALVIHVTPHSFRPGVAGDLLLAGEHLSSIMQFCRWWSERVARMYAERPALSSARSSRAFHTVHAVEGAFTRTS